MIGGRHGSTELLMRAAPDERAGTRGALGDRILGDRLGVVPEVFAYTGTTFSLLAGAEARRRYRFARLWITGADYETDRGPVSYADLVGVAGPDEDDGGPPVVARYVTEETKPYRLPAMELQG